MLSADVKRRAASPRCRACSRIVEGVGSSESPAQAVAVTTRGCGAPTRRSRSRPRPRRSSSTTTCDRSRPGPGAVGRLATRGRVPLGYYKDPRAQRAHVRRDRRRALVAARRHGDDRRRRHRAPARARFAVHQHRRREGVPRRGRGGAQGCGAGVADAVVVGVARRAIRRSASSRSSRPPTPRSAPDLDALQAHCRDAARGLQGAARPCTWSTTIRRNDAGKVDYAWARTIAGARREGARSTRGPHSAATRTALEHAHVTGHGPALPSNFRIGEAAAATIGASSLAAAELDRHARTGRRQEMTIDVRHAAVAFVASATCASTANPWARSGARSRGFYRTADDGWIQLHTNFPHHLTRRALRPGRAARPRRGHGRRRAAGRSRARRRPGRGRRVHGARTHDRSSGTPIRRASAVRALPLLETIDVEAHRTGALGARGAAARRRTGPRSHARARGTGVHAHARRGTARRSLASSPTICRRSTPCCPETALGKQTRALDLRRSDDADRLRTLVPRCRRLRPVVPARCLERLRLWRGGSRNARGPGSCTSRSPRTGTARTVAGAARLRQPRPDRVGDRARAGTRRQGVDAPRHLACGRHDYADRLRRGAAAAILALQATATCRAGARLVPRLARPDAGVARRSRPRRRHRTRPVPDCGGRRRTCSRTRRTGTDASRTSARRATSRRHRRTGRHRRGLPGQDVGRGSPCCRARMSWSVSGIGSQP